MFVSRLAVLVIVACAASLAACGGGGSKSSTPTAATPGQPAATSAAGQTPGATSPASNTPASDITPNAEIQAVVQKFAAATFKGTYNLKTTNADTSALEDGQLVLYKQGDTRLRFEVTVKRDGVDSQIIFIQNGATSVFCLKDAAEFGAIFGIPPGQGLCFNSNAGADNPVGSLGSSFSDIENADVTVLDRSQRTIAGKDGDCYRLQDNQTSAITAACFSSDGVILYSKDEGGDVSEIEATDISGTVSDSDFDPPYEVRDLGDTGIGAADTPTP